MQITITHGEKTKTFDLEKISEMRLKNIEYFLKKQKDALFESLLNCKANRLGSSFERCHEINDALAQIEVFKFEKEFSV